MRTLGLARAGRLRAAVIVAVLGLSLFLSARALADAYATYNGQKTFDTCTTNVYAIVWDYTSANDLSYGEHRDDITGCATQVAAKAWWYKSGWYQTAWATGDPNAAALMDYDTLEFGKASYQTKVGSTWGPITESPVLDP